MSEKYFVLTGTYGSSEDFHEMQNGPGRSETIFLRFNRALGPKDIFGSRRALGDQNYIFRNYERALISPKEIFGMSETVLIAIKRLLGDLTGPWELPKSGNLKGLATGGLGV